VFTVVELATLPLFSALAQKELEYLAGAVEDIHLVPGWRGVLLLHPPSRTVSSSSSLTGIRVKPSIRGAPGSITWASKSTHVPI
jgi:hypothetical protein